jgi:hypothetical protein
VGSNLTRHELLETVDLARLEVANENKRLKGWSVLEEWATKERLTDMLNTSIQSVETKANRASIL